MERGKTIIKWTVAIAVALLLVALAVTLLPPLREAQPVPAPYAEGTVVDGGMGYANDFFGLRFTLSHGGRIFSTKGTNALIDKGVKDFELGKAVLQSNLPFYVTAAIYPDTGRMLFVGCSKYAYPKLTTQQLLEETTARREKQKTPQFTLLDSELTAQIGGLDFVGIASTLQTDDMGTRYQEEYFHIKEDCILTVLVWGDSDNPDEAFLEHRQRVFGDFTTLE